MKQEKKTTKKDLLGLGTMKGFEYAYPERKRVLEAIEQKFRAVASLFGFDEIEGPLLQPYEFYSVKSGDELLMNTYTFKDADGSELVLRPELTPTVAYMIAKNERSFSYPLRWWNNTTLFRKENPQKGRKRQFNQLNVDIYDLASSDRNPSFDDAEIINFAIQIFKSFSLTEKDIVIRINSRGVMTKIFDAMNLSDKERGAALSLLDKSEKIPKKEFDAELKKIAAKKNSELINAWLACKTIDALSKNTDLAFLKGTKELDQLESVFENLNQTGASAWVEFSPNIVRGLGYYTGTVFEAFDRNPNLGLKRALLGGGRYDNLTQAMGGKLNITAVGFGLGQVPLEETLNARNIPVDVKAESLQYYIIVQSEEQKQEALKLCQELRSRGKSAVVDPSLAKEKLNKVSKQLQNAVAAKAQSAVLIFPDEWKQGKVLVKELEKQAQKTVSVAELTT